MKNTFKIPRIFLVNIMLIFLSTQSFAQPRGMTMNQVYSQINKQTMNQQMDFMRQMQMAHMNWRQFVGKGDSYDVTFKDNTKTHIKSYMYYDTLQRKSFLVFVNNKFSESDSSHHFQKIYPDQTISITADEMNVEGAKKHGLPTDSGWKFKVVNGPITVYARSVDYFRVIKTPIFGNSTFDFDPSQIIGIQFNDGPIEKLTKENVSTIVALDAKAIELTETKGLYETIKRYNKDAEKAAKK